MLKLQTNLAWHEFAELGVKVAFRPVTRAAMRQARTAMLVILRDETISPERERAERSFDAFCEVLLVSGIDAWEGVDDHDDQPLAVTPETIRAAIADPVFGDALIGHYAAHVWAQEVAKNVSSPGSNGTSKEGTPVRGSAKSSAKSKARATTPRGSATAAPTTNTRSKPKPPKTSSKS